MTRTLTLKKPIQAHGKEVTVLTFNEPTGDDILEFGVPSYFDKDKNSHVDMKVVAAYVARLANIPMSSVKKISPPDLVRTAGVVASFFGDSETSPETSSGDTTNSQDSTAAA